MYNHILVRYGELSLKKSNRQQFIRKVNQHIMRVLKKYENLRYESRGLRFYILLNGEPFEPVIACLTKIPGLYSFSPVFRCNPTLEDINELAISIITSRFKEGDTFKVSTNRADKNFPLTSLEITKEVSRQLFKNVPGLKADVHQPSFVLDLDLRQEGAFLFTETYMGAGGLPAGILGKGLLMISGGIDSIIAGYLALKKGIDLEAIHFASPPYTSDLALQKVIDLIEAITPYASMAKITLHVIPFTKIQDEIYKHVREDYGITVMRRMMYRISDLLCQKIKASCIINGESVGQVASQTLESIQVINEVTTTPVIRPLAMFDKQDIINIARGIKTFEISTRPYDDCCTIFVPRHPQTKPRLDETIKQENKIDFEKLIAECLNSIEKISLQYHQKYQLLKTDIVI